MIGEMVTVAGRPVVELNVHDVMRILICDFNNPDHVIGWKYK
jgi:hypothetical protein